MKRRARVRWILGAVPVLLAAPFAGCSSNVKPPPASSEGGEIAATGEEGAPVAPRQAVKSVVEQVAPSMVQLTASMPPRSDHAPLSTLEGDPFVIMRAGPLGTGVVVGHNLVLTTAHVVDHAGDVSAHTGDGRTLPATVVSHDAARDLALLRVQGDLSQLRPIALGAEPRAGDVVLALGNLYGMGPTVTVGVVSSNGESGGMIETDAAINLTNTGGPVVNMRGELVGIANAKLTEERGMRGLGYVVAADAVGPMLRGVQVGDAPLRDGLAEDTGALRGLLTGDVTPELRSRYGISEDVSHGAVIVTMDEDAPAARVGIEPGDVVVEVDFVPVLSQEMFEQAAVSLGGPLLLLVVRGNAAAYVLVHP